ARAWRQRRSEGACAIACRTVGPGSGVAGVLCYSYGPSGPPCGTRPAQGLGGHESTMSGVLDTAGLVFAPPRLLRHAHVQSLLGSWPGRGWLARRRAAPLLAAST